MSLCHEYDMKLEVHIIETQCNQCNAKVIFLHTFPTGRYGFQFQVPAQGMYSSDP